MKRKNEERTIIHAGGGFRGLALSFVTIIAALTVVDSTIVGFLAFSNIELLTVYYLIIFTFMFVLFILSGSFLLKVANNSTVRPPRTNRGWLSILMYFVQSIIIGTTLYILIQMILLSNYQIIFLEIADYVTHISTLLFLGYLVAKLVKWIKSKKNLMVISYAVSFSLLCVYIIVSCSYLAIQIISIKEQRGEIRIPVSIHFSLTSPIAPALQILFGPILDVLSLGSYLSAWIATTMLLSQYRQRIGKLKYWCLMIAPLVYFLFPFGTYFIDLSEELMSNYPVLFSIIYVSVFSATKQVGGILFSMVFLTAATVIVRTGLRRDLIIASIGISVIFGCIGANSLIYVVYPPFGLITISFMPIGAYLLFKGIDGSARQVSGDSELRKKLHKSAESQLSLLKTIGMSQMESDLLKKFRPVLLKTEKLQENNEERMEQEDVRLLIRDVLNEIESRKQLKQTEN